MSNEWRQHNGGPQPVGDDVWVEVNDEVEGVYVDLASGVDWPAVKERRILNQHLIDAARLEGIRLGLEAAATTVCSLQWEAARELEESDHHWAQGRFIGLAQATELICNLNPETIAREAVLDQLTSEAQADNMGYDKETAR